MARRSFPRPDETSCPSSIAGSRDKTVVLLNFPNTRDVTAWLEEVRAGRP